MTWKHHSELSPEEALQEKESLEIHFAACEEIGQGINTKETVRYKACCKIVEEAGL